MVPRFFINTGIKLGFQHEAKCGVTKTLKKIIAETSLHDSASIEFLNET